MILNHKNIIIILMSVELILLSVNINLVAFSTYSGDLTGQAFALFILTVAAARLGDRPRDPGGLLPQSRLDCGPRHQFAEGLRRIHVRADCLPAASGFPDRRHFRPVDRRARRRICHHRACLAFPSFSRGSRSSWSRAERTLTFCSVTGSTSGRVVASWALRIDTLTAVMLVVVTTVSFLVHVYSIGYMADDPSRPRFFAYLSLFTFAMLMLVTSDNLVQLFFGWEGVGLMSYLLVGFWYEKPSANAAAIKAFVVNRVGDFGFSLGIFLTFYLTGSIAFDQVFAAAPGLVGKTVHFIGFDWDAPTLACLLLFMGAMGKSAQFLLHTWLPDAMEGPTRSRPSFTRRPWSQRACLWSPGCRLCSSCLRPRSAS